MFLRNYYNAIIDYGCTAELSSNNTNLYKAYAKDATSPPTSITMPNGHSGVVKGLLGFFPKGTKEQFSGNGVHSNSELFIGVIFGTGTTEPTLDDYQMSGDHFVDYTASKSLTEERDDSGITYTCVYTLTNTSSEDVTIGEIGISYIASRRSSGYTYYTGYLIERTLLETPITISPGGVGQITYTVRINYYTI